LKKAYINLKYTIHQESKEEDKEEEVIGDD